ncbi:glycoside hydrolase family 2 protein [Haloarcula pelagica]|uniref:glycoside hydrolase family 2 protein n=1 Tax=Haloarcula pelagica TaxID=3033389 RepID=UPI0024C28B4B|nr:sugar-binding domain-containing protein [Halomicroarcula sp. YJ-61-S]
MSEAHPTAAVATRSISLDGSWLFRCDPDDAGIDDDWASPVTDWDDAETRAVDVPHAWQEHDDLDDYTGAAWYRRTITVEELPDDRDAVLRFGAVDYESSVWVNGQHCGDHRGGYLPFDVDVTDALEPGTNVVTVRVQDPENIDEIPHGKQGDPWYTRVSGIWQSVSLELRPHTRVADARATPDLDADAATIDIEVVGLAADASDHTVRVRVLRDGDGIETSDWVPVTPHDEGATGTASVTVSLEDPDYWHPDDPVLYDFEVDLADGDGLCHTYHDYFGMRSVSFERKQLYLNGDPLFIRGALDQGYYPKTLYRPFEDDLFEREIATAKDLGFNMLRKHIKPAHPDFLEAADRMGILVWEEVANPARYTERSKREVREQARELIDRDFNRPSVVAWSLYNEEWGIGHHHEETYVWDDTEKQETLGELYERASEWDPTRLVCDNSGWAHVATDINDYHQYFASPDRADAWEANLDEIIENPADNYAAEWTEPDETPIVMSEFGTWGLCDTERLIERYDGPPPWFYHSFLIPEEHRGEELDSHHLHLETGVRRSPAGFEERYEQTSLPEMVGGLDALSETWQWRQFVSLKDQIESMRTRDELAGYVITEWTDLEWEFNGILDYFREQKVFHDDFAAVNDALVAVVEPERHVCWAGEPLPVEVSVVNDTGVGGETTVSWAVRDGGDVVDTGETTVDVDAFETTTVDRPVLSLDAADAPRKVTLEVAVEGPAGTTRNEDPLVVVPSRHDAPTDLSLYVEDHDLAERLRGARYPVVDDVVDADVVVSSDDSSAVEEAVADGTPALFLPEGDDLGPRTALFDYRELPPGENWNLASATYAQASPLLDPIADGNRLGWGFEGMYPYAVATDLDGDADDVHVGYIEGWMANWGSPLVFRDVDDATACSCTFRIGQQYGEHPTATYLFDTLVAELAEGGPSDR